MGLSSGKPSDAWYRAQPRGRYDFQAARKRFCRRHTTVGPRLIAIALALLFSASASIAETLRIATFAAPLSRDGPGLLLRDILRGEDDQIAATLAIIAEVDPDILVLTDIDWDQTGAALAALNEAGPAFPHLFTARPNAGVDSGFDLDGNGRLGEARDAWGYGRFTGDGGLAVLSRLPISGVQDHSGLLWAEVPGAKLPVQTDGSPFYPEEIVAALPLSSTAHWTLTIAAPDGPFDLMVWSATPPVFDGPEDANGLRARDELLFWTAHLDTPSFVLAGNANLDPMDGEGDRAAIAAFLADPRLIDPRPVSDGGAMAPDPGHRGDPALDTADWRDGAPGNLRVSYVLPSADWRVLDAGVFWPAPGAPGADLLGGEGDAAGAHRLVWVDIAR